MTNNSEFFELRRHLGTRMKILLASTSKLMINGASWSLLGLAENLIKRGYDVTIAIPGKGPLKTECDKRKLKNVVFCHYPVDCWYSKHNCVPKYPLLNPKIWMKHIFNFIALQQAKHYLKKEKFDLVHINASTDDLFAKAAKATKTKFIWHFREFMEEDLNQSFCNQKKAISEFNQANLIVAISNSVKEKYASKIKAPITVVYNGIIMDRFIKEREIFTGDTVNIILAGRITPNKGQHQLVEAVVELKRRGYENIHVQLIGSVVDRAYLEQMKKTIRDNKCENQVEFIEFTNEIESYYWKSDIVCVCSKKEAFGRVTVEGMATGAVVIGSTAGGTMELIESGVSGYLYEEGNSISLADQIQRAMLNIEEARRIALNGQKWVTESFTAMKNAENIAALYEKLVR